MKISLSRSVLRSAAIGLFLTGASIASATAVHADATDGIVVTSPTAAEANSWRGITFGNGTFVAVAQGGTNQVILIGN